jgi:hypothetical protein
MMYAIDYLSAEGRTRTDTAVSRRRILSPVRLPIPPPRQCYFSRVSECFRCRPPPLVSI